jgi:hypothetical protein
MRSMRERKPRDAVRRTLGWVKRRVKGRRSSTIKVKMVESLRSG